MADHSSQNSRPKLGERSVNSLREKLPISLKENFSLESDKENRVRSDSEGSGVVKSLKMRFEEIALSRKIGTRATSGENGKNSGGAVKKRAAFGGEGSVGCKKRVEIREDKKVAAKVPKINTVENEYAKSRFKIYSDELLRPDEAIRPDGGQFGPPQGAVRNQRLSRVMPDAVHPRFTPIDAQAVPLAPKKVKVQHRKSLMTATTEPISHKGSVFHSPSLHLPFGDEFIELELQKEKPLLRMPRSFGKMNISAQQRNIIVKFLTRLNAHSFYPSFFLYQTVRIFDAVLEAKLIPVEEMQLVALAAMWIVLKKEQIAYKVPSAVKMLSYSKDLYEGRVDLLLKCERDVLRALNFEIVFPDPFSVLFFLIGTCRRSLFCTEEKKIEQVYYCGSYMIDLSLFDEELMKVSAVLLAAVAAETALYFVMDETQSDRAPMWFKWRSPDAANRYSEEEISSVRTALIQRISESHHGQSSGAIIFKKYSRTRYGKVAALLCNKVKLYLGN